MEIIRYFFYLYQVLVVFLRNLIKKAIATDAELLSQFQLSKDLAVLQQLYDRYIHLVYGVCMKYLKDEDDAKDATMQIYEKLAAGSLTNDVQQFDKWLYTVAKNFCLMTLRKQRSLQKNQQNFSADFMESTTGTHLIEENDWEDKIDLLDGALQQLPEEQEKCIHLFYIENKCYKEIAEATGYDLNKVKSYIQNGKRNLRILLDKKSEKF